MESVLRPVFLPWRKNGENIAATVLEIKDGEGNLMDSCPHPKQRIFVKFSCPVEEFDLIRQKAETREEIQ